MIQRDFEIALAAIPTGYGEGHYSGRRYGTTVKRSADGRRISLFAEELAGTDKISFNLFQLGPGRVTLKPCEMPQAKVLISFCAMLSDGPPASLSGV